MFAVEFEIRGMGSGDDDVSLLKIILIIKDLDGFVGPRIQNLKEIVLRIIWLATF